MNALLILLIQNKSKTSHKNKMNTYIVTNPENKKYTVDAVDENHAKNLCQPMDKFLFTTSEYKVKKVTKK